ncbi:MAG TPA: hypothetical protein VGN15_05110, partial [Ktedonobacteraceae bacterium]|nr:hypothetical protein [Ktedonobacteraceae bacterium]
NLNVFVFIRIAQAWLHFHDRRREAGRRLVSYEKSDLPTLLTKNMVYLRHASHLELDEEALHGAEAACSLR